MSWNEKMVKKHGTDWFICDYILNVDNIVHDVFDDYHINHIIDCKHG